MSRFCSQAAAMLITDVTGYVAAALVLAAFCMHSMTALRILATLSNLAFIAYAYGQGLMPILILHAVLLPVNVGRLYQILVPAPEEDMTGENATSLHAK
jgi:CRP/FNR family transcriptional regulator, cyclic AMP receptor protein